MVAPTGFEPATSALRGRRPKPLDDGATLSALASIHEMPSRTPKRLKMAGVEGVEPSHTAPETAVLPLDDTPVALRASKSASRYLTGCVDARQDANRATEHRRTSGPCGLQKPLIRIESAPDRSYSVEPGQRFRKRVRPTTRTAGPPRRWWRGGPHSTSSCSRGPPPGLRSKTCPWRR